MERAVAAHHLDYRHAGPNLPTPLAGDRRAIGKAQQEAARAKAETEQLRVELQDERAAVGELKKKLFEPQQPLPSPPRPATTPVDLGNLGRKLASRLDTPFYTSQPLEERTLVAGLTGSWYVIRPKLRDKPLAFADGQFRLPGAAQELTESVLQLEKDLLAPIRQMAKKHATLLARCG
jgi:hypothetical protein